MSKLVSVVVLNWNGKKFIDGFIDSLDQQTYPKNSFELIFVDNASKDDSVEYFKHKIKSTNIVYSLVLNDENYGYAGGNNKGFKQTNGDYILVCNNDVELDRHLLTELVSTAESTNSAATVPKLMYLNRKSIINNAGSEIVKNSDWPVVEVGANEKDNGQYEEVRKITAFCGACVLFRRDFLETVGLFDTRFFMYFEDGDLSWRGLRSGYSYYYAPKAIAEHHHTGTSKEGSLLFNFYVGRNRLLILTKNGSVKPLVRAWVKTLVEHFMLKIKRILLSLLNRYPKKQALREFVLGQKIIWAAVLLSPYALGKRFGVIKEDML